MPLETVRNADVRIVTIYAPRRQHPKWLDYVPLLRLQRESCRRFGLRQIVITDPAGADELREFDLFVDPDMPQSLMPALTHGLWAFVLAMAVQERLAPHSVSHTLICGADGLVCRDPRPVFDPAHGGDFDAAFTTHPFHDCILNTGAQFISAGSHGILEAYYRLGFEGCGDRWGDDQKAFAANLDPVLAHGDYLRPHPNSAGGHARIRFLPVPGYNDAPDHEADSIGLPVIAHFRGSRKRYMAAWARRHLGIAA